MVRISVLMIGALAFACESSSSSTSSEAEGGALSSGATGGVASSDAGQTSASGGGDGEPVGGQDGGGAVAGDSSAGADPIGAAGETSSSGGAPNPSGGVAISALDECKYAADNATCAVTDNPHYWECDMDPNVSPGEGCMLTASDAVSRWCCPEPFCSAYAGAASLCEGLYPEQPNSLICATGTSGLADCKQPNPGSLPQVYCCP